MTGPGAGIRLLALRGGITAAGAIFMLAVLPAIAALFANPREHSANAPFHGARSGDSVHYEDVPVAEVMDDIALASGVRVVAFPDVGGKHFSGTLRPAEGARAAGVLARRTGLTLRQAGPHLALTQE